MDIKDIKNTKQGDLIAKDLKFAIVISRWHEIINEKLLSGAIDCIVRHGGSRENITVIYVPGTFETSLAVKKIADNNKDNYDAIIALGTIIRGSTLHFDLIAAEAFKALSSISLESGIPVAMGILTTDNLEQAFERAGSKHGNKGVEATLAAIEMSNLLKSL